MCRNTVRGRQGGCEITVRLPIKDGAMETVQYMCHVGRYLVHARLDYVTRLQKCISLACVAQLVDTQNEVGR